MNNDLFLNSGFVRRGCLKDGLYSLNIVDSYLSLNVGTKHA